MFQSLMIWFLFLAHSYITIMFMWTTMIYICNIFCRDCFKNGSQNDCTTYSNVYTKKEARGSGFVSRYPIRKSWARPRGPGSRHFKTGYM